MAATKKDTGRKDHGSGVEVGRRGVGERGEEEGLKHASFADKKWAQAHVEHVYLSILTQ